MKRFIIISLLAVLTVPSFGCLWIDTDNYYLFNICNGEDFADRADKITRDNWKAYLGVDEFWWFDADKIIKFAQEKNDALRESVEGMSAAADPLAQARLCRDSIVKNMEALRTLVDEAEMIVDSRLWPFPGYGQLLTTK